MNIIYLHGLASSGKSNTAKKLRELFPEDNVISPDIPVNPIEALQLLLSLAGEYQADNTIVIGTSMGAMYASQMKGFRRILVNPAFHVSDILEENKGKRLQFFSEREDGAETFTVSEALCREFKLMESNLVSVSDVAEELVVGLFGDADDVCDCLDEYRKRFFYWATFSGGHRMTEEVIENVLLPTINCMRIPDFTSSRVFVPFEDIASGDTGFIGDMNGIDYYVNAFKIYKKGMGRKWYEEIVRQYHGSKDYDGRDINLHFPVLPEGADAETVQLVYGNRYGQPASVEVYGEGGVQVTDGDFYINDKILVHRAR